MAANGAVAACSHADELNRPLPFPFLFIDIIPNPTVGKGRKGCMYKVARWPPRPPPWRNPRKGRDLIFQRSVAERSNSPDAQRAKHIRSINVAIAIWKPCA